MKISYVATDLEFDSTSDLSHIVDELGENVSVHLNEWVENVYRVALGIAHRDIHVEESVAFFCSLLERLSDGAKPRGVSARVECSTLPSRAVRNQSAKSTSFPRSWCTEYQIWVLA
jgi:hypothetical protein